MWMTVNGGQILHYEVVGDGDPVILCHGNGEDLTIFNTLSEQLSPRYRVYRLDTRGHGQSGPTAAYHYRDMAEDVACFIRTLELETPIFYGFSDGGIIGLILASTYPDMLGKLIVSGANTAPDKVKYSVRAAIRVQHLLHRDPKMKLMLEEPDITDAELAAIRVPTLVLAGENDVILPAETRHIAAAIPGAKLLILPGEGHGSYIINNEKLYAAIQTFLGV